MRFVHGIFPGCRSAKQLSYGGNVSRRRDLPSGNISQFLPETLRALGDARRRSLGSASFFGGLASTRGHASGKHRAQREL